jgi:hypothetical protein
MAITPSKAGSGPKLSVRAFAFRAAEDLGKGRAFGLGDEVSRRSLENFPSKQFGKAFLDEMVVMRGFQTPTVWRGFQTPTVWRGEF